jgi:hypothetical protein
LDESRQNRDAAAKRDIVTLPASPRAGRPGNSLRGLREMAACVIMPRDRGVSVLSPSNLFRLLNEFILLLLGALLIVLAVHRGVALPARPSAMIALGVLMLYWGLRARGRRQPQESGAAVTVRAGSLILVGVLVLSIPLLPVRHADMLLALAGGVLVLRGVVGGFLFVR